jgi:hypothetical protein
MVWLVGISSFDFYYGFILISIWPLLNINGLLLTNKRTTINSEAIQQQKTTKTTTKMNQNKERNIKRERERERKEKKLIKYQRYE